MLLPHQRLGVLGSKVELGVVCSCLIDLPEVRGGFGRIYALRVPTGERQLSRCEGRPVDSCRWHVAEHRRCKVGPPVRTGRRSSAGSSRRRPPPELVQGRPHHLPTTEAANRPATTRRPALSRSHVQLHRRRRTRTTYGVAYFSIKAVAATKACTSRRPRSRSRLTDPSRAPRIPSWHSSRHHRVTARPEAAGVSPSLLDGSRFTGLVERWCAELADDDALATTWLVSGSRQE